MLKLKRLSEASGVSSASIKFYLREGLLQPGRKRNATLSVYGDEHLKRLELISTLREVVGAPLKRIGRLIELIDDPGVPLAVVMEEAQLIGMGEVNSGEEASTGSSLKVAELIRERGWPDSPSEARRALGRHIDGMQALGLAILQRLIDVYAQAADLAASAEIDLTPSNDRDEAALQVAVGVHSYTKLLMRLVALAQASVAIARFRSAEWASDGR